MCKLLGRNRFFRFQNNLPNGHSLLAIPASLFETSRPVFMAHVKLHIPGPVEVSERTFRAFCSPMIGHRGQGFKDLYAKIQPQLQQLFFTRQLVYLSTSSAWGVMEGAIRNLVTKKVLCCMCGAFSDKWLDVAQRCGKQAEGLKVEWGSPILPDADRKSTRLNSSHVEISY